VDTKLASERGLRFACEMAVANLLRLFRCQLGVAIPFTGATTQT
jgi:hypothetical protein